MRNDSRKAAEKIVEGLTGLLIWTNEPPHPVRVRYLLEAQKVLTSGLDEALRYLRDGPTRPK